MNGSHGSTMLESAQNVSRPIGTNRKKRKPRYKRNPINRELTYERLIELLTYDPKTGKFFWRTSRGGVKIGTEAGCMRRSGYVDVRIDWKHYKAHRLAWLYVHGYTPENYLDHIDRDPTNNRVENLREVSQVCNLRNCGNRVNNTTGVKGVHWDNLRGKWHVYIMVNKRRFFLGYYHDFANAVCARLASEQCLNWEGCDSSSPAYCYVQENITGVNKC